MKSRQKLERLLVKHHLVISSDVLSERKRENKLKILSKKIGRYEIDTLRKVALKMSKKKEYPTLMKLWCDIIILTGEL